VSKRTLISGCGLSVIDKKGRVALPPTLRNAIIANNLAVDPVLGDDASKTEVRARRDDNREFFVGKHPQGEALIGYDGAIQAEIEERISTHEAARSVGGNLDFDFTARRKSYPRTEPVPFDASGRFTLSPRMIQRASLDGWAFFYGLGKLIEIWNPQILIADPDGDEEMQDECRFLMREKGLIQ
jgi:MraZ protein